MKLTIFKRLTFGYVSIMALVVFLGGYSTLKLSRIGRMTLADDAIDGGSIRLAEHIFNCTLSQEGFVQVSIADTGPGIPGKDLEKIFDKVQRIENGIETARGTGLGLPIAEHIITDHGGCIWVENHSGEGSTFSFTLPVYSASC